jgi:hypothetical protein
MDASILGMVRSGTTKKFDILHFKKKLGILYIFCLCQGQFEKEKKTQK